MKPLHSLLQRQMKRHLKCCDEMLAEWQPFLEAVNDAYLQCDENRASLERSLELSSVELQQAHSGMRAVYERLISSSVDGIFAFDRTCCFTVWNPAMERIYGISQLKTLGKSAFESFPMLKDTGDDTYFSAALAGQTTSIDERAITLPQENEPSFFDIQYAPLYSETEDMLGGLAIMRDVTKRKQAEDAQQRQREYLSALQAMALRVNNRLELAELLHDIMLQVGNLLETEHAFLTLVDADGSTLVNEYSSGIFDRLAGRRFTADEGMIGPVWQTGQSIMRDDIVELPGLETLHSWVTVPLFNSSQVIGVMGAARLHGERAFHEHEMALLKQFAQLASIALSQDALNAANARLAAMANTDPLTGVSNHRVVMDHTDEEVSRCQRHHKKCAVLFIDIDHFKAINDTWGHRAGDAILREVSKRLSCSIRVEDFVGRYGGEEFAVVLTEIDAEGAKVVAEQLRVAIADQPYLWKAEEGAAVPIPVTASIGIAVYPQDGATREALIEAADAAMYQAKQRGRNRVCLAREHKAAA